MIWRSVSHYGDVWAQERKSWDVYQDDCKRATAQNAGFENSASSLRCLNNAMTTVDELAIARAVYLRLRWAD